MTDGRSAGAELDIEAAVTLFDGIGQTCGWLDASELAQISRARHVLAAMSARTHKVVTIVGDRPTAAALESLTAAGLFEPDMVLDPVVEIRAGADSQVEVELLSGVRRAIAPNPDVELALERLHRGSWWSRACRRVLGWFRWRRPDPAALRRIQEASEFAARVQRLALRVEAQSAVGRVSIACPAVALPDEYVVVDLRGPSRWVGGWSGAAIAEANASDVCLLVVDDWTPELVALVKSLERPRLLVVGPRWSGRAFDAELVYLDELPEGARCRRMLDGETEVFRTGRMLDAVRDARGCLTRAIERAKVRDRKALADVEAAVSGSLRALRDTARSALDDKLVAAGARAVEDAIAQLQTVVAAQRQAACCTLDGASTRAELQAAMLGLSTSLRATADQVGAAVSERVEAIGRQVLVDALAAVRGVVAKLERDVGGQAAPLLAQVSAPAPLEPGAKLRMVATFQVSLAHMTTASSWMHSVGSIRSRCVAAMNDAYANLLAQGRAEALDAEPDVRARLADSVEARLVELELALTRWAHERVEHERARRHRAVAVAAELCRGGVQSVETELRWAWEERRALLAGVGEDAEVDESGEQGVFQLDVGDVRELGAGLGGGLAAERG